MKSTELRLGNFIKWVNNIEQVRQLFYDGIGIAVEGGSDEWTQMIECDDIEGIRLTHPILKNAGFTEICNNTFESKEFDIWVSRANISYTFTGRPDGGKLIKYVHELQNLIFALTGKELEFKEPITLKQEQPDR